MEPLIRLLRALYFLDSICATLLLARLAYLQIHKRYPALVLFLAMDVVAEPVAVLFGIGSRTYYWTYFVCNALGSALLIWMCREMFAELYFSHPGLRGMTKCTLARSIVVGAVTALIAAPPVGLLHWGDPQFDCWQFPFIEVHRCLCFGAALFVMAMWRKLRSLPLDLSRNVKTYACSACLYWMCLGLVETAVLAIHTVRATIVWSDGLLIAELAFYGSLALRLRRPGEIRRVERSPVDPREFEWLSSISSLFIRVNEAESRGRASAAKRLPFLALLLLASAHSAWKVCARAAGITIGLVQKE